MWNGFHTVNRPSPFRRLTLLVATVSLLASLGKSAAAPPPAARSDRILIQPKAGVNAAALKNLHSARKGEVLQSFPGIRGLQVVRVPAGESVTNLIAQYQRSGLVEFAEPDNLVFANATMPNDPKFLDGTLWALNNYGQSGGMAGADLDATNAWDVLTSASNIIVAVLDSGIRATHEDLAANMWVNPYDGGHGFNAFTGTNDPADNDGHGTMVAGILGAVGNNGTGITGVAWQIQLMACKCLNGGTGSDSTVLACIDYAMTNGTRIINASFDSPTPSLAISNAISILRASNIIWVASAGNGASSGRNVDVSPSYPTCYPIDNIVSVAYTTRTDALGFLSNYGATNVLLAAPGDQIYSTTRSSDSSYDTFYTFRAGTSYAAPFVAGACALLMAQYPADTYQETIARLLGATDPLPSLAGKCRTGGRLNLAKILRTVRVAPAATNSHPFTVRVAGGLNRTCVVESTTNLISWSPVFTNSSSTNGTFDFTDSQSTNLDRRFYRASANP